jgi:thiamine monophosphate kinase
VQHGLDRYETVLAGGEDYVLLFTLPPRKEMELRKENIGYSIIGEINRHSCRLTVEDRGEPVRITTPGYDHFTSGTREDV